MIPVDDKTLARLRELERDVASYGPLTKPQIAKRMRISRAAAMRVIHAADTYSRLNVEHVYVPQLKVKQYRVSE